MWRCGRPASLLFLFFRLFHCFDIHRPTRSIDTKPARWPWRGPVYAWNSTAYGKCLTWCISLCWTENRFHRCLILKQPPFVNFYFTQTYILIDLLALAFTYSDRDRDERIKIGASSSASPSPSPSTGGWNEAKTRPLPKISLINILATALTIWVIRSFGKTKLNILSKQHGCPIEKVNKSISDHRYLFIFWYMSDSECTCTVVMCVYCCCFEAVSRWQRC